MAIESKFMHIPKTRDDSFSKQWEPMVSMLQTYWDSVGENLYQTEFAPKVPTLLEAWRDNALRIIGCFDGGVLVGLSFLSVFDSLLFDRRTASVDFIYAVNQKYYKNMISKLSSLVEVEGIDNVVISCMEEDTKLQTILKDAGCIGDRYMTSWRVI